MSAEREPLITTSYLRKVGTDFFKYWPTMIIPTALGLITVPIYTRLFTTEEYGYYVLVNAAIMLVSTLGVSWVETAILRFYAEYRQRDALPLFITTVLVTTAASLAAIAALGGALLGAFRPPSATLAGLLRVGLWVLLATSGLRVLLTLFRSSIRATEYAIWQTINVVAGVALGLGFVLGLRTGIAGLLYGTGLVAVLLIPVVAWRFPVLPYLRRALSGALVRELAAYGLPMAPTLLGNWALSLSDRYILEHFRSPAEVGWYSVSYSLAEKALLLPFSALMFAATPILVAGWEQGDRQQVVDGLKELTRWYLLIGLPLLVGISVLAQDLVRLLAAGAFVQGYRVVPPVSAGIFLWGLSQYVTRTFVLLKKSGTLMSIVLLSSAVSVLSNLLIVPRLGAVGAGLSALTAFAVMLLLSLLLERPYHLYRFPVSACLRIGLAAAGMGAVVWLLRRSGAVSPYLLVPLGCVLYGGGLLAVREVGREDLARLRSLLRRGRSQTSPGEGPPACTEQQSPNQGGRP